MATVYFGPYNAIKYVGTKAKEFTPSLARPKPILKKGDIVIVDKTTAFNLVNKGFGDYVKVDAIEFVKSDTQNFEQLEKLKAKVETTEAQNIDLFARNANLTTELDATKNELLELIAQNIVDVPADEASGDGE